jgi:hypothetical protein
MSRFVTAQAAKPNDYSLSVSHAPYTIMESVRCEFLFPYSTVFNSEILMYGEMSGYERGRNDSLFECTTPAFAWSVLSRRRKG